MFRSWFLPPRFLPIALSLLVAAGLALSTPATADDRYAAVVIDAKTGKTLFASSADARRYPASLTKMMTLYILFEELDAGRLTLNSRLSVSQNAQAQAPSKLGLRAGSSIRVEDAIKALTVKSANDVAVVIAENIGGSVSSFAARMNRTARAIGMRNSNFRNPNGLPDAKQMTTARDMAQLGIALQDRFPRYYGYFATRTFSYAGRSYRNYNRLLGSVEGVDGIKTGYTRASGFNLVSNVKRGNRHIVAVVMGGKTSASRDAHMRELIAEYLPDGSRGARTAPLIVADTGAGPALVEPRMPRSRPEIDDVAIAYAAVGMPAKSASVAAVTAQALSNPLTGSIAPATRNDPIAARIAAANEVALMADLAAEGDSEDDPIAILAQKAHTRAAGLGRPGLTDAGPESRDGWHIQIGAVPTKEGAEALIGKAKRSMGDVLASAAPFTQPVEKNGSTLYRARFAGFSGKDDARQTCAALERKSFSCLAVPN